MSRFVLVSGDCLESEDRRWRIIKIMEDWDLWCVYYKGDLIGAGYGLNNAVRMHA